MAHRIALYVCIITLGFVTYTSNLIAQSEKNKPENTFVEAELVDGKGRDETEAYCAACHSLNTVTQQKLSRNDWDELLVWMVEEQAMPEIPKDDRKLVLDYLAKHYGVDEK